MRLNCPHCDCQLNVIDAGPEDSTACPSCGTDVPLMEETVAFTGHKDDRIGLFQLLDIAGRGQFGTVYRARDTKLDRIVALKLPRVGELDDRSRALFIREASAAAAIQHPNIVPVYETGEENGEAYIVSQFINGITLSERLKVHRFTPRDAAELIATVADAVHHGHEAGVIHRDLKPGNIMIDTEGTPFVMDFGLAKRDSAEITLTVDGMILGTPAYMSPEQARGDTRASDRRSDVYSLGVVLYELLTGEKPFEGSSRVLLHQIQSEDPRAPRMIERQVPRDLETICLKAMAKAPEKRFQTAEELSADLRRFLAEEPILARRVSRVERAGRWIRRNRLASVAMFVAVLAVGLVVRQSMTADDNVDGDRPQQVVADGGGIKPAPVELETVHLTTEPEGATVVFYPLSKETGEPQPDRAVQADHKSPVTVEVEAGTYLVVAAISDEEFHEVYRQVPKDPSTLSSSMYPHRHWKKRDDGSTELRPIRLFRQSEVTGGMSLFKPDGPFKAGHPTARPVPEHSRTLGPFHLDNHEVTVQEYLDAHGGRMPLTLMRETQPPEQPLVGLLFNEATAAAERFGKRLPTEFEFEYAATNAGWHLFPWGDEQPGEDWLKVLPVGEPKFDRQLDYPQVTGLFSNASEWTSSWHVAYRPIDREKLSEAIVPGTEVVVRGGPAAQHGMGFTRSRETWLQLGSRYRFGVSTTSKSWELGFRCARSARPRLKASDF